MTGRSVRLLFSAPLSVMLMVVNYGWGEAQGFGYALPAGIDRPMLSYQPVVSYRIDAELKLDEAGRPVEIDGRQRLAWFNETNAEASELQFHLYLNAFRNERSTFLRSSGGAFRRDRFGEGEWGSIDIREMRTESGEDLTRRIEFINPDDSNVEDRTVIRVPLTTPIRPGEKIILDIAFNSRLPRVYARTGYWGSFALVGQWFPKLGVFEPAGERGRGVAGWNCHQFHAHSEFYADFGEYDVRLKVPAVYRGRIGATGQLRSENANGDGTVSYNFYQRAVHDFAWTVDTRYQVYRRRFVADKEITGSELAMAARRYGLSPEKVSLSDIEVTLLLQPEHAAQAERHFRAAFNAIKYFGLWYGRYPWDTLTIVDPPYNAEGAGGMEYPTFITAGTRWRPGLDQNPETVIVHEYGHQYWQGMVATNEFEESWLDEGFNTWSTAKVLQTAYGDDRLPVTLLGVNWGYLPFTLPHPFENRLFTLSEAFNDPVLTPSWKFFDYSSYSINSYSRAGLVLSSLEGFLGQEVMDRLMRTYLQRWQYRHPGTSDFIAVANEVANQDLSWFFDQFVRGTGSLDYEIIEADSRQSAVNDWSTTVTIRRTGEAWFPVDILLTFADGERVTGLAAPQADNSIRYRFEDSRTGIVWNGYWPSTERWLRLETSHPARLDRVEVDPWRKALLDVNLTNNTWTRSSGIAPATRWTGDLLFWVEVMLQLFIAI
ncbi:MAG: M1 family peptidase [Acidobacteria bacterium]|nr:M1 family peptidase [Acidobacteriota bacterium]